MWRLMVNSQTRLCRYSHPLICQAIRTSRWEVSRHLTCGDMSQNKRLSSPPPPQLLGGQCATMREHSAGCRIPVVRMLWEHVDWVRFPAARLYIGHSKGHAVLYAQSPSTCS